MLHFYIPDQDKNFHYVVDCGRQVMKEHCYWPLVSDLNNVLSHKPVAVRFMSDNTLLEMWFDFLSMFQGIYDSRSINLTTKLWMRDDSIVNRI